MKKPKSMLIKTGSIDQFFNNLKKTMRAADKGEDPSEMLALEETAYLLRSPVNAKRLLTAVDDVTKNRRVKKRGLLEDER